MPPLKLGVCVRLFWMLQALTLRGLLVPPSWILVPPLIEAELAGDIDRAAGLVVGLGEIGDIVLHQREIFRRDVGTRNHREPSRGVGWNLTVETLTSGKGCSATQ